MDSSISIEMPALLDCLRKDIYSLLSKLQLPQDQQVQIGQLIEQIRLEENKYEQDIRKLFETNRSVYEANIDSLREKCNSLESKINSYNTKGSDIIMQVEEPNKSSILLYISCLVCSDKEKTVTNDATVQDIVRSMKKIREDLVNVSMETRLSLELGLQDTKSSLSQVNSSLLSIVEKYQSLNFLYVNECARRRKVFIIIIFQ